MQNLLQFCLLECTNGVNETSCSTVFHRSDNDDTNMYGEILKTAREVEISGAFIDSIIRGSSDEKRMNERQFRIE
jgi:hypothetical protein